MARVQDIPDAAAKKPERIELPPVVAMEREVRRFIRKDGVFLRDVEQIFARPTGVMKEGRLQYVQTKNREEAEDIVTEICEKSGRKVERDGLTDRLKATPGWDLTIKVPGMASSETHASQTSESVLQQRANNELILSLKKQNEKLAKKLTDQTKAFAEQMKDLRKEIKAK